MAADFGGLEALLGPRLRRDEPLARHTSFRVGGPADAWARAENLDELLACLGFARDAGLPVTFLARGTNVLVRDGGIRGLVLTLGGAFEEVRVEGARVRAGAAASFPALARRTALAGLKGLEWGAGIPGSVGGALVMNAGAHGGEVRGAVRSVSLVLDGRVEEWPGEECGFAYRHSRFKGFEPGRLVLTGAEFALEPAPVGELKAAMEAALERRRATQPLELPNAGCAFKNPEGDSAGRLIEACGLKGLRLGGAAISPVHANFVVNEGGARAADILALMGRAREAVRERFGVELREEILVLGEEA